MSPWFEWDPEKARKNREKHGVSFDEAITVFDDPFSGTILDQRHSSEEEDRHITMGTSARNRLLVVVHCDRMDASRIISARLATSRERWSYEEEDRT